MKGIKIFEDIARSIEEVFGWTIPDKYIAIVFLSSCAIAIIWSFIKYIIKPIHNNRKWRKDQLDVILKNHKTYLSKKERWLYIDTYFQTDPPHDYDELSESDYSDFIRTKNHSIYYFLDKAFTKDNDNPPFYCILGGSGMGKTTFAVNLVRKYINKYKEKTLPYPIKLLYCGARKDEGVLLIDDIRRIENKENTILVLDALDENNEAITNFGDFFPKLLKAFKDFRIVVLTCRTQFFESKNDEPSLLPFRDETTKQQKRFKKYYVSPFNKEEVNHYLNKKYFLRVLKRIKAGKIMENCKKIMARPLLLSYMDDLVNAEIPKESISGIYNIIIDKWLEREAKFATDENTEGYKQKLLDFSTDMAVYMARFGYTEYNKEGFNEIIDKHAISISEKNLKGRSLLNRNSNDDYKFAHKSFLEYLVARNIYKDGRCDIDSLDCTSYDMIPVFWTDLIKTRLSTIGYNNWTLGLSKNLKNIIRPSLEYHDLSINDDIRSTNSKFLLKLIRTIEFNHITIDCNYRQKGIWFLLHDLKQTIKGITIYNYAFMDLDFAHHLVSIAHDYPYLENIFFMINDLNVVHKGDIEVLYTLNQLQKPYPKRKTSTSITIYVYNQSTFRHVPYNFGYNPKTERVSLVESHIPPIV